MKAVRKYDEKFDVRVIEMFDSTGKLAYAMVHRRGDNKSVVVIDQARRLEDAAARVEMQKVASDSDYRWLMGLTSFREGEASSYGRS